MKQLLLALALFTTLSLSAQSPKKSAEQILKETCETAKKENKKVFLIFHASWCGWCHEMDRRMNLPEIKPYFDKNYVIEHITVSEPEDKKDLETPGGSELMKKYGGDKKGIPFWLIFDGNGELIADSQIRPSGADLASSGENIGCPQAPKEIVAFKEVLKRTTSLTDAQIGEIAVAFEKKK